jgi:hypothetical protein
MPENDMRAMADLSGSTTSSTWWRFPLGVFMFNLLILSFVTVAHGKDFVVKKNLNGYTLEVALSQNPPILGKNGVKVEIKDSLGKNVVDSPVTVNYFMPPMPGMPPMNYTVKASPGGSGYSATMDLIMKGPWNIVIRANVAEKPIRMTVLIDVR